MRILWLSINSGLFQQDNFATPYNGGGWISSLQQVFTNCEEHQLALAFLCPFHLEKEEQNHTLYYPIFSAPKTALAKIKEYYGGYKKLDKQQYVKDILRVIEDFQPDIIHLFGIENPLATILGNTSIPIVVHVQGLLAPIDNAFFPNDFNKSSFLFPFSMNEWLLRNGYVYAKNNMHVRGLRERELFKKVDYVMGRTAWDYQVSQLLAPKSQYFHVNEVLRESFYKNAGKWEWANQEFTIISTISNTVYKGLDVILKTAQLLKRETNISFKWQIVGIKEQDKIIRFFERKLKIDSRHVNIEYRGVLSKQELCDTLLTCHLYVHPSYIDNSPNSICEAQMLGVPVIGTFVGGIPSLIKHEETGLLVPANAPYELTYQINKCHDNKEFCIRLGQNGCKVAQTRHNKKDILNSLISTYRMIINLNKEACSPVTFPANSIQNI